MNCPSRVDALFDEGYNQNPNALNADATTRADLDHMANARLQRDHRIDTAGAPTSDIGRSEQHEDEGGQNNIHLKTLDGQAAFAVADGKGFLGPGAASVSARPTGSRANGVRRVLHRALAVLRKYSTFIGPGFMVSVAYIDPGMLQFLQVCRLCSIN
jgi:metal iron transporter